MRSLRDMHKVWILPSVCTEVSFIMGYLGSENSDYY